MVLIDPAQNIPQVWLNQRGRVRHHHDPGWSEVEVALHFNAPKKGGSLFA